MQRDIVKFYFLSAFFLKSHPFPFIYIKVYISIAPSYILLVKLNNPETLSHSYYSVSGHSGEKILFGGCCSETGFPVVCKLIHLKLNFSLEDTEKKPVFLSHFSL